MPPEVVPGRWPRRSGRPLRGLLGVWGCGRCLSRRPCEGGVTSTPRPIGSSVDVSGSWIVRTSTEDDTEYDFAFSRRICARGLHFRLALFEIEGAGKTGCALHPRSRVQFAHKERAHEHTGSAGASRPSLRNGFTAYFVLFPENGFLPPSLLRSLLLENLAPAPRRQDHTTSPYAQATHVSRSSRVHRISPRVRDDGQRPSSAVRRAELCR